MLEKVNLLRRSREIPFAGLSKTGLKGSRATGATLVNRQSSSCSDGKPRSAKRANPALRSGKSHDGCFGSRSKCLNRSKCAGLGFSFAASVVTGINSVQTANKEL